MLSFTSRWKMAAACLAALVVLAVLTRSEAAFPDQDQDSEQRPGGFGQTDSSADSGDTHYHFHYHYHPPYLSHYDSSGASGYGGNSAQPFAPNGTAGANRYYTQGYLNSSRTPSPSQSFVGDRDDEDGQTEIMDQPGSDEADSNDEVGENVDEPPAFAGANTQQISSQPITPQPIAPQPSFYSNNNPRPNQPAGNAARPNSASRPSSAARPSSNAGPVGLPGDRGYLRVLVPMPETKLIYDGHEVPGNGLLRLLMTARIQNGGTLTYTLVASWKDISGKSRVSVHDGAIEAGEHQTVEFNVATGDGQ